ncbi:hypothetical protein RU89_GL000772 [Lactococcus cremoris]|uniref:Uncharacterized protein n=1 Tax=Lactococcus cremoris subsp. tructae TaxID=542833 RepID=A0A2A5SUL8_LACLC|nr:hypothetical protein AB995_2406 [Lactococcus cremoris]PCS19576.1 hypothetical protein RU92_GL001907 [Lactococcus cremoris subsp. tructae]KZK42096.1 hypothetical protein LMG6897_0847 [Lactococcus cremoris]KZK44450.1 hypothetical protein FG2_2023 [Lactococcus cremoris]KZK45805.1 hypothetical protein B40_0866 [Lactococcus cremoris]
MSIIFDIIFVKALVIRSVSNLIIYIEKKIPSINDRILWI